MSQVGNIIIFSGSPRDHSINVMQYPASSKGENRTTTSSRFLRKTRTVLSVSLSATRLIVCCLSCELQIELARLTVMIGIR